MIHTPPGSKPEPGPEYLQSTRFLDSDSDAVRRFALGLIRVNKSKGSVKTKRKTAGWDPAFLLQILQQK